VYCRVADKHYRHRIYPDTGENFRRKPCLILLTFLSIPLEMIGGYTCWVLNNAQIRIGDVDQIHLVNWSYGKCLMQGKVIAFDSHN
jgi:hypothetical protein